MELVRHLDSSDWNMSLATWLKTPKGTGGPPASFFQSVGKVPGGKGNLTSKDPAWAE